MTQRLPLDRRALGCMLTLCLVWGVQQVALKATASAMAPMLQIGLRSAIAAGLVGLERDVVFSPGMAGAALDVLREEPPQPGNKVWAHPKAFVTPHIAAQASADTVARQCLENLRRLGAGEPLLNLVDVARGY